LLQPRSFCLPIAHGKLWEPQPAFVVLA